MTRIHRVAFAFACALAALAALASSPARAEVYKWVDAQGRTHYGERPSDAGTARVSTVKLPAAPPVPPRDDAVGGAPATRRPTPTAAPASTPRAGNRQRVQAQSDGRDHGTDASRCALARDVLSGAVKHTHGARTDDHDREVARNDVQAFCGRR